MTRAAVLIGVDRTGHLPVLQDAAAGARRMEGWARAQGIEKIAVLTDEDGGEVTAGQIKKAIRDIVEPATTEQILLYFAGHGVNIRYGEYWLLSGAPDDTSEAVNVEGSAMLARYCGIPHVVLISDACRTAAQGIQAGLVTGSEVFPNVGPGGPERWVDQFFACTLGRPANEIADPRTTVREFSALYTTALLGLLQGADPAVCDWQPADGRNIGYLRPRRLKPRLRDEMIRILQDRQLATRVIQEPDARITSDETAWIARLERAADLLGDSIVDGGDDSDDGGGSTSGPRRRRSRARRSRRSVSRTRALPGSSTESLELTNFALNVDSIRLPGELAKVSRRRGSAQRGAADLARRLSVPFGPEHHETQCGFKVRGQRVVRVDSALVQTEMYGDPAEVVRVNGMERAGASVLLEFENGTGALLPAIPEFLAGLTVEEGELVDVSYEPSDNTWRWGEYKDRAGELRALRGVAASATRKGRFRLEGENALRLARRMQIMKGVDPTLSIYAAYAYHDLARNDLLDEMYHYQGGDLGGTFLDVALLARKINGIALGTAPNLFSQVPLLSQGWALLAALGLTFPPGLDGIRDHLLSSVWTLFDPRGVERLREALHGREIL